MSYTRAHIRTDQKCEWLVHVFFYFVAPPIFRINIYGAYFVKIETMLARPKKHQQNVARPIT